MSLTVVQDPTPLALESREQPYAPLWKHAVCLIMTFHKMGIRRRVQRPTPTSDAAPASDQTAALTTPQSVTSFLNLNTDENRILVTKSILDCPEYHAIQKLFSKTKKAIDRLVLPSGMKPGMYLVPIGLLDELQTILSNARVELDTLVDYFCQVYPRCIEQDRAVLLDAFNQLDYPALEDVKTHFSIESHYMIWDLPGTLSSVSDSLMETERKRAKTKMADIITDINSTLRGALQELVSHLAERLTPNPDGTAKRFNNSTVTNLLDFLSHFEHRNLGRDQDLASIVEQAKSLLSGVSPTTLRTSDTTGLTIHQGLNTIKTQLDQLLVQQPARRFYWDQDAA